MKTFSFRAEFEQDVDSFLQECRVDKISLKAEMKSHPLGLPDVVVEIKSSANLLTLQNVMRRITDSHVMLQTLRECPLDDNTLERDYPLR